MVLYIGILLQGALQNVNPSSSFLGKIFGVDIFIITFHLLYAFFAEFYFYFIFIVFEEFMFFVYAVQYWYERLCYSVGTSFCCFLTDIWHLDMTKYKYALFVFWENIFD